MDFTDFKTGADDTGRRLDKVIRIFVPTATLPNIYKSLRKGFIKVNGAKAKPDYRINDGDIITIADFLIKESQSQGQDECKGLCRSDPGVQNILDKNLIVFENEHILILNKPAGINVHSAAKNEISLQDLVVNYYKSTRTNDSLSFKPGPLHRIDKYTQGLVCFSMSTMGAQWFGKNMTEHKIKKLYEGVVEGTVSEKQVWIDKIEKLEEKGDGFHTVKVFDLDNEETAKGCRECKTTIIPIETFKKDNFELTRAQFDIETGRQHQIRAQSAYHGYPLYGDSAYGGHKNKDNKTDHAAGFYLTAKKIEFPPNDLGIPQTIELFTHSL